MRKIYLVTKNDGKYLEVKEILKKFGLDARQIRDEKSELQDDDLTKIAIHAAAELCKRHKKPIIAEDTGIFFEAYDNFPGAFTKFVYQSIGFDGIFRLLDGKSRKAYFKTIAAYCEPGKQPITFEGIVRGRIASKAFKGGHVQLPYDQIFIPDGYQKTYSKLPYVKQGHSQRRIAFEKLGQYLQ